MHRLLTSAVLVALAGCALPSATLELPPDAPAPRAEDGEEDEGEEEDEEDETLAVSDLRVKIPAGVALLGSAEGDLEGIMALCERYETGCVESWFEAEAPRTSVDLESFWIDGFEVTNADYESCVAAGACTPRALDECEAYYEDPSLGGGSWSTATPERLQDFAGPRQPAVCVTPKEAQRYCRAAGGELPTRGQWEAAANGGTTRIWPWGNELPTCAHATFAAPGQGDGCGSGATRDVGSTVHPSPHGVFDMAGNAAEWVQTLTSGELERGGEVEVRGGHWSAEPVYLRCAERGFFSTGFRGIYVGFRCAYAAVD